MPRHDVMSLGMGRRLVVVVVCNVGSGQRGLAPRQRRVPRETVDSAGVGRPARHRHAPAVRVERHGRAADGQRPVQQGTAKLVGRDGEQGGHLFEL